LSKYFVIIPVGINIETRHSKKITSKPICYT